MSASTERKNRQAAREAGTDKKTLAAQEEARRKAVSKRKWTLGTILVVLLVACILVLNSGLLYTHTTAVTIGDTRYSPADVNYRYAEEYLNFANQYGSYASLFGLDTSLGLAGLADQPCSMTDGGSWKDYFLDSAISGMVQNKALLDYAAANSVTLDQDEIDAVDAQFDGLDDYAKSLGYANGNALLATNYGTGVNQKLARQALMDRSLAAKAYTSKMESLEYSAEALEEYYQSLAGASDVFAYALYHVAAETVETTNEAGETVTAPNDETRAAAKATAEALAAAFEKAAGDDAAARLQAALDELLPGETVSERSNVSGSAVAAAYHDWMLDSARQSGDLTVAEDDSGCNVVIFLSRDDNHYPVAQVRHILVKAVADENGVYTDEAKAEAKAKAEALLAQWEAGDKTEESFAALAEAESEDAGSAANGGLYDEVRKGQMVPEFDAFCFGGHQSGDTAIVYGESTSYAGYHVMYYVGEGALCSEVIARGNLESEDMNTWLTGLTEGLEAVHGFGYRLIGK